MAAYVYNMTDTWNGGSTTFTAIKMNVTDTASDSASLLIDLQVGGFSFFNVLKTGGVKSYRLNSAAATEYFFVDYSVASGNIFTMGTDATGTGTQRPLIFYANGYYFRPAGIGNTTGQTAITSSGIDVNQQITANANLATPAGGTASTGIGLGSALIRIFWGSGAPSASVPIGSLYLRTDPAGATSRAYIATSAAGAYTNITCAA